MSCSHPATAVDEATKARVCTACGLVLAEADFETRPVNIPLAAEPAIEAEPQLKFEERFWMLFRLVRSICTRFALGSPVERQANLWVERLYEKHPSLVDRGRKGRLSAACAIYEALKAGPSPLSLADLADALGEPRLVLGQHLLQIHKSVPGMFDQETSGLDACGFMERFLQDIKKSHPLPDLVSDMTIVNLAKDLANLGSLVWFDTGRKPESFALSCLLLALEHACPKFLLKNKASICKHFGINPRTLNGRIKELEGLILTEAAGLLPWKLDERNLHLHLAEAVNILLVTLADTSTSVDPPAFQKAESSARKRKLDLEETKLRLAKLMRADADDENLHDSRSHESNLLLERLLLLGVPESEILECTGNKALVALSERYEVQDFVDIDDVNT